MDAEKMRKLNNLTEDQLKARYEKMLQGFSEDPKEMVDPTAKAVYDLSRAAGFSEKKRYLLTILYQNNIINELKEAIDHHLMVRGRIVKDPFEEEG